MEQDTGKPDNTHHAFGQLLRFVYCLLQMIRAIRSLPVIEKWEPSALRDHFIFPLMEKEHLLEGTCSLFALEKFSNSYLKSDFRTNAIQFLKNFVRNNLSTDAARYLIVLRLNCFCPESIDGGDDCSAF